MKKYDLTIPQKNIWNLQKFYENTSISNLCGAVFYDEKCDIESLKKAINKVIEVQEGLRLRFCYEDDTVKQYVFDYQPEDFTVLKFDSMAELDEYAHKRAATPMSMVDSTMYSFEIFDLNGTIGVLLCANHLITDAWSFSLIAKNIYEFCIAYSEGKVDEVPIYSYLDFVNSEQDYFTSKRFESDEKYWNEVYLSKPQTSYIKTDVKSAALPTSKRFTKPLEEDLTREIDAFCEDYQISQAVLFEAAVFIYLKKINAEVSDINIGFLVINRRNSKEKSTVGMFISTIPLKVSVSESMSAKVLCGEIASAHMKTFRHQRYPYSKIADIVHKKFDYSDSLYNAMVSFQNAKTDTDAYTKWYSNGYVEVPFSLHIDNRDGIDSYTINIDYQTEIFKLDEEIFLLYERLTYIIKQIITNPEILISEINILPSDEYQQVIYGFNDTAVDYPRDKCVQELFSEQAAKNPDKIALISEDKKFTYKQLDEMSNSIANCLRTEKGIKSNDIIPIISNRSWKYYVIVLAILKAGGAFLTIDSTNPKERMLHIIKTAESKIVITINNDLDIYCPTADFINFDSFDLETKKYGISCINKPDDLCYVIFTSGSTGEPKGLMISHRNIMNFCHKNEFNVCGKIINRSDVLFLSITNTTFDMFIAEILLPLSNGIPILFANDVESVNQNKLNTLCQKYKPTIIQTTPTKLRLLTANKEELGFLSNIDTFILGGEPLPEDLNLELHKITNVNIYNNYGPAETTVWSTSKLVNNQITIGKPIANTQIYILDQTRNPLPVGVAGELCISGDGVGMGYLNKPDLTAEKFIPNPFVEGKTMYCTGDLARWRVDGEIEYLGRIDTQVKIRGLRIELGEIESVMSSFEGIKMAAAADKRDENNRQYLVGYYIADNEIDEKSLRKHLSAKLPKYMIPNYFVHLDKIPLTTSGKIDRKSLPEIDLYNIDITTEFAAPETEQQKTLCMVMEKVLNIEKIGIDDDFFEIGCDSLKAIEFVSKAHYENIVFSLQNVFDYPTIRALDEYVNLENKMTFVYDTEDFADIHRLIGNTLPSEFIPHQISVGDILLTGATGFLGIHILANYLENDNGTAFCVVRGKDEQQATGRLEKLLRYYFDEKFLKYLGNRIIILCGDITKENFGIADLPHIDTIIHTAASVKHYGSYEYFKEVNVNGVVNAIEIAKKQDAKLIHISTLSVSGNSMVDVFEIYHSEEEKFFSEKDLYIGQPLNNVYIRSKFEAEREVYNAVLNGLKANVIRVGNLTNRASDKKFQPNYKSNAFLKRVKAVFELGYLPEYLRDLYCEFSPVDDTADAIMRIVRNFNLGQIVFMVSNHKEIQISRILEIVNDMGIHLRFLNEEQFANELKNTQLTDKGYVYEALVNDMDEDGKLVYDTNIRIVRDTTAAYLRKLDFEWTDIDAEYLKAYIEYFRKLGYLKV